jgi:hypothetical protein
MIPYALTTEQRVEPLGLGPSSPTAGGAATADRFTFTATSAL